MGKQIYILNSLSGNAGVVRIIDYANHSVLSISLDQNFPGRKICRIISGDEILNIGSFYKKRTDFEIPAGLKIDNILIEENDNRLAWSGEIATQNISGDKDEAHPEKITFDNFFGGGFEWHRIRGNFIMFDYSIVHHILSLPGVYRAINRCGYYCAGIRSDEDLTMIAIAIPLIRDIENPFSALPAEKYKINSGKIVFDALCLGIDKTGEFFIST